MTDQTYMHLQLWMIMVLLFADTITVLVQYPQWFQ